MKFENMIGKTALIAAIAFGAVAESANAVQPIHADYVAMNPQMAKRVASEHKQFIEHSPIGDLKAVVPDLNAAEALGLRELVKAKYSASLDDYVAEAKKELADDLIAKAWQIERTRLTGTQDQKLTSVFSRRSILGTTRSITG